MNNKVIFAAIIVGGVTTLGLCLLLLFFLFGGLAFTTASRSVVQSGNTAEEMLTAVVSPPASLQVTNLQGGGDTWQGYAIYLRFEAADFDDFLLEDEYEPADCEAILDGLTRMSDFQDQFSPPWMPGEVEKPGCFIKSAVANSWTNFGTHYVLVDLQGDTVYFAGIGS